MLKHSIKDGEQLPHAGGKGYLLGFSRSTETMVKVSDSRVVAGGYKSSHIKDCPYGRSFSPNGALAPEGAAIPVKRGLLAPCQQFLDLSTVSSTAQRGRTNQSQQRHRAKNDAPDNPSKPASVLCGSQKEAHTNCSEPAYSS